MLVSKHSPPQKSSVMLRCTRPGDYGIRPNLMEWNRTNPQTQRPPVALEYRQLS